MTQPLILRTNEEPTFFNKEAAIGFIAPVPFGTIVGAVIGKKRMEREQANGKLVGEPSTFNKDALLGGLLGWMVGGGVAALALTSTAPAAIAIAVTAALGSTALGATIGGKQGKETQEKEYALAVAQQREQQIEKSPSISKNLSPEYGHEVKINHAATIQAEKTAAQSQQKQM